MKKLNKLGVENSLWNNIRKKAQENKATGKKPNKPSKPMLVQEKKIKATAKKKK
jgi:hypothetical protein